MGEVVRQRLSRYDKTIWGKLRDPIWVIFTLISCVPINGLCSVVFLFVPWMEIWIIISYLTLDDLGQMASPHRVYSDTELGTGSFLVIPEGLLCQLGYSRRPSLFVGHFEQMKSKSNLHKCKFTF